MSDQPTPAPERPQDQARRWLRPWAVILASLGALWLASVLYASQRTPIQVSPPPSALLPDLPQRPRDPWFRWLLSLAVLAGIFGVILLLSLSWISRRITAARPPIELPVLKTDVSAYHVIQPTDLTKVKVAPGSITKTAVRTESGLIGRYALVPLPAGKAISTEQVHAVRDATRLASTVSVAIPATSAMVQAGNLKPGDVVDILFSLKESGPKLQVSPDPINDILVLDVKAVPETQPPDSDSSDREFVVVIALPQRLRREFAVRSGGATWLIAKKP
jgi:Flp pilus assembly protein CpaB